MSDERRPTTTQPQPSLAPGDRSRFDVAVLPYLDAACNLARYLLRDAHDAEDAVQDAFVRALRHVDSLRGADGRAWLLQIVRNACFTRLRRERSAREGVEFDEEMHTPAETDAGPEAEFERTRAAASVKDALAALPPEFREVLVLREMEGLSYKEIADVAGIPIGTVMSRLARGRKQLAAVLAPASDPATRSRP